jgi:hypothetical protein
MSKSRKFDDGPVADRLRVSTSTVALSRRGVAALLALLIVPWIVVAVVYMRHAGSGDAPVADPLAHGTPEVSAQAASGQWGALQITPIVIAPPIEYVPMNWGPVREPAWYVPDSSPQAAEAFLVGVGLAPEDAARVAGTARPAPEIHGVVMRPDADLVRGLSSDVRGRLYLQLSRCPLNEDQAGAYRFYGQSIDDWLAHGLAPETVRIVEPLVYRHDGFMYFADLDLVRRQITDQAELQRLAKRLFRQATAIVKIRVDASSDVGAIADYWGRGGRRMDVRPLLESIAGAGPEVEHTIDIMHLLPPFAREHLYRYPRITVADFDKPLLANCFWTALNFFNVEPDDHYLDVNIAIKHLKEDYYVIQDGFQLGDIVAFSDGDGNLVHVAVYLADNLVFGKNGSFYLAPWSILPMARLRGHYSESGDTWNMTVHRRKDL